MPTAAKTCVNEKGGKQSYVAERMDLIPTRPLLLLAQCLGFGAAKYGENNWHLISERENLNHAQIHITLWLDGDRSEPHLVNAAARIFFALWHAVKSGEQPTHYNHPELGETEAKKRSKTTRNRNHPNFVKLNDL